MMENIFFIVTEKYWRYYDNKLLGKLVEAAVEYLPENSHEITYAGAKEMLPVEEIDN